MDLFNPQIKLNQETPNQKFMDESVSFRNENIQDQEEINFSNYKEIIKSQKQKLGYKTLNDTATLKQNNLRKFLFNQSFVKQIAQNLIKKSYIIQDKFKNNILLKEEYLNNYSFKLKGLNEKKNNLPLININNKIIQIWELFKLLIYFQFMWVMPFSGVFLINEQPQTLELILFYLIVLDKFLELNKEIIVEGQLINDRRIILKQYIKNSLIFEMLYMFFYSSITYQFFEQEITQIFNIGFFFLNLKKFQQCIQNYQESSRSINDKINLIELIITVLMLAHLMACIWFYVGKFSELHYDQSWIMKLNLQNETIFTQYCYSFYWAATTMVTVGYGDITGQNLYEIICSTILLFFSSGIFAFSINSIGMILNNINQNGQQYRRNLLLINQYMTENEVSNDLQIKVRNYLQFYYQSTSSNHQKDVNTIIEQLSINLKAELISDIRFKTIQSNLFITSNFSNPAKKQIIQQSQLLYYSPLEQIYQQQSNNDHSLYVISKGFINLIEQNSGRIIQQLQQGDCFGEIEFLSAQPRYLSAYSQGFSQILKISRNDFIQIITQIPQDYEQFHMLKDRILFNLNSIHKCNVCKESHIIFQCNKLFYKPNIEKIIKIDLFHTHQDRQKFDRNRQKNQFELKDNQMIKVSCQAFRYDNDISKFKISHKSNDTLINSNSNSSDSESKRFKSSNQTSIQQLGKRKSQIIQKDLRRSYGVVLQKQQQSNFSEEYENQKKAYDLTKLKYQQTHNKLSSKEQVTVQKNQKIKSKQYNLQISNQQSNLDQREFEDNKFSQIDIDQQMTYQYYFPNSNIKNVLRLFDKLRKENQNQRYTFIHSNYRFFQLTRLKPFDEQNFIK